MSRQQVKATCRGIHAIFRIEICSAECNIDELGNSLSKIDPDPYVLGIRVANESGAKMGVGPN